MVGSAAEQWFERDGRQPPAIALDWLSRPAPAPLPERAGPHESTRSAVTETVVDLSD
jgi:hypothetical protein